MTLELAVFSRGLAMPSAAVHDSFMISHQHVSDDVLGVILAGGQGRRLGGGDKSQRLLAGRPLLDYVVDRIRPQLAPRRLVLNANGDANRFGAVGLPVIADTMPGQPGPLAGILAAMMAARACSPPCHWVFSVPTDTPFLPRDLLQRLLRELTTGKAGIVLAASAGGLCQVCGLWPLQLAGDLAQSLAGGQNGVLAWASRNRMSTVVFPPEVIGGQPCDPFFNINSPEDLAVAERLVSDQDS